MAFSTRLAFIFARNKKDLDKMKKTKIFNFKPSLLLSELQEVRTNKYIDDLHQI